MTAEVSRPDRGRSKTRLTPVFVWSVWLLMTVAGLTYVVVYGRNVPSLDEWDMVPTVTGVQPVTWEWLWSQHNEHRIPVARLIMLGLYRRAMDFRAGMVFNVLLMAVTTAWLLRSVAKLRGRTEWMDVFLPLVALNLGQGLNFIWGWQIEFFVSTALMLVMLVVVSRSAVVRRRGILVIGGVTVLLAGSGAHGLVPIPAIVGWAICVAWLSPRYEPDSGRVNERVVALAMVVAVIGVALVASYLIGYENVPHHPTSPGIKATVLTAIQAVTMSFGAGVRDSWPVSGGMVLAIVGATIGKLVYVFWRNPAERVRVWGLACFISAIDGLAAALGLGRNGFEPRYVTLLFPILCGCYFVWSIGGEDRLSRGMRTALATGALLLLWPNTRYGLDYGKNSSSQLMTFEREMAEGVPSSQLIARHWRFLHPAHGLLADYMPMLRSARWGEFVKLRSDPIAERITIPPEQWKVSGGTREGHFIRHDGKAVIDVKLPAGTRLAGVALKYDYQNTQKRQPFVRVEWRREGQEFGDWDRWYHFGPTGDRANWERISFTRLTDPDPTLRCWIWDEVTELRILPDYWSGRFELKELILTIPKAE
jgi:hypothetical protein